MTDSIGDNTFQGSIHAEESILNYLREVPVIGGVGGSAFFGDEKYMQDKIHSKPAVFVGSKIPSTSSVVSSIDSIDSLEFSGPDFGTLVREYVYSGTYPGFLDEGSLLIDRTFQISGNLFSDAEINVKIDNSQYQQFDSSKIWVTFEFPYKGEFNLPDDVEFQPSQKQKADEYQWNVQGRFTMQQEISPEVEQLFDQYLVDSYYILKESQDDTYRPQVQGAFTIPQDSSSKESQENAPTGGTQSNTPSSPPRTGQMQQLIPVGVLEINGQHFPNLQFRAEQAEHCSLKPHYHSKIGIVFSLEGGTAVDPDPKNCGFGIQGAHLGFTTYFATQTQINEWEERTGLKIQ